MHLLEICWFTTLCIQLIYQTNKLCEEKPKLLWLLSVVYIAGDRKTNWQLLVAAAWTA